MGKTGRLGPSELPTAKVSREVHSSFPDSSGQIVVIQGADIYRLNCRACHGESGLGAFPEIGSVINPVRATSARAVMERMRNSGIEIPRVNAEELAQQAKNSLLQRLHHGGVDMPAFPQLSEPEIRSLVTYLRELADLPGAEKDQLAVGESRLHLGEQLVKSTCHICHSATGHNPTTQELSEGAIPPLSVLTIRTTREEFIRKVRHGLPVTMGAFPLLYRGRMPVFYYLSEREAADAYIYLNLYQPHQTTTGVPVAGTARLDKAAIPGTTPGLSSTRLAANQEFARAAQKSEDTDAQGIALLRVSGLLVGLLLATGFGYTLLEFRRLSQNDDTPSLPSVKVEVAEAHPMSDPTDR